MKRNHGNWSDWYRRHKAERRAYQVRYRLTHSRKESSGRYYRSHKDSIAARVDGWRKKNPAARKKEGVRMVSEMPDYYIRSILVQRTKIPRQAIPQGLVDLCRMQLKIKRLLKEKRNEKHQ